MNWTKSFRLLNVAVITFVVMIAASCGNSGKNKHIEYVDSEEGFYEDEESGITDGTYSAEVDYYNPDTGYSATYTLDVEVQDGCVTTIYFPNDGYLDDTHIDAAELDEDGCCTIYDDESREFSIHIDF